MRHIARTAIRGGISVLRTGRGRYVTDLVPHKDARAMVRHLRRNRILWYAPDQDFSRHVAAAVTCSRGFFAERAATTTATAWLAGRSGARVVPFASYRLADEIGLGGGARPRAAGFSDR